MSHLAFVLVVTFMSSVDGFASTDPLRHTFLQRVDSYVALHRRLEGPLPPEAVTPDPNELFAPRKALAAARRKARAGARQGEMLFTRGRPLLSDARRQHCPEERH